MNELENPFTPKFGLPPFRLFGREKEIHEISLLIIRTAIGSFSNPIILVGFKGMGKTAILNKSEQIAKENNAITLLTQVFETGNFRKIIFDALKVALFQIDSFENLKNNFNRVLKIFKGLSISYEGLEFNYDIEKLDGECDSGTFQYDLVSAMVALGETAKANKRCICFILDELQYTTEKDKAALFASVHRITQLSLPISFICAGLPQLLLDSTQSKSYTERSKFIKLTTLSKENTIEAVTKTILAKQPDFKFDDSALNAIFDFTKGYPYYIQQIGYDLWNVAEQNIINENTFREAKKIAQNKLDEGFFSVRFDRATDKEEDFLNSLANLGDGPYKIADVKSNLQKSAQWINSYKDSLIKKGLIHSQDHGIINFTVPLFADFLRRRMNTLPNQLQ